MAVTAGDKGAATETKTGTASVVARLAADGTTARDLLDKLSDTFDPEPAAVSAYDSGGGRWSVDIHFLSPPNETAVRALVGLAAGAGAANALMFERIAARDWVKASLEGLPPVAAGRFVVHGAYDRTRVPVNRIGIEIEAALAFGTGHHGTTKGCLFALDRLIKQRKATRRLIPPPKGESGRVRSTRPGGVVGHLTKPHPASLRSATLPASRGGIRRILDLGTGTGVLGIAAARALHSAVLAGDIDPRCVQVARANARHNRVTSMAIIHASGLRNRRFRQRAPFDLVLANILLGPLQKLATPMARLIAPGGHVVLSGLLTVHAHAALAAYCIQGFVLKQRITLEGWTTLVLRRPSQ